MGLVGRMVLPLLLRLGRLGLEGAQSIREGFALAAA